MASGSLPQKKNKKVESIQLSDSTGHQVALHDLSFDLTTFALLDRRTDVMNIYVLSLFGFCDNLQLPSYRIADVGFSYGVSAWRRRAESIIQKGSRQNTAQDGDTKID